MSSKKNLLLPGMLLLITMALVFALGQKKAEVPCAATPCDKLPNCCLPTKPNSASDEPLNPHQPINNFILQI